MSEIPNDISISEISGHLRKMHREFKVYEKALEVADALDNAEKDLKAIRSDVDFLKNDKIELEQEIEDGETALAESIEKQKQIDADIAARLKETDEQVKEKLETARRESEKLVNDAAARIANLQVEIKKLSNERNKALDDKKTADEQLRAVHAQIKSTKEKFIESL